MMSIPESPAVSQVQIKSEAPASGLFDCGSSHERNEFACVWVVLAFSLLFVVWPRYALAVVSVRCDAIATQLITSSLLSIFSQSRTLPSHMPSVSTWEDGSQYDLAAMWLLLVPSSNS